MTKIAYNACFGGFSLSDKAIARAQEVAPDQDWTFSRDIPRTDPTLIQVIEELGSAANGTCARLAIAELPAGTRYRIDEYDGSESVMTLEDYDWQIA